MRIGQRLAGFQPGDMTLSRWCAAADKTKDCEATPVSCVFGGLKRHSALEAHKEVITVEMRS